MTRCRGPGSWRDPRPALPRRSARRRAGAGSSRDGSKCSANTPITPGAARSSPLCRAASPSRPRPGPTSGRRRRRTRWPARRDRSARRAAAPRVGGVPAGHRAPFRGQLPRRVAGHNVALLSDLPSAAGLSSSSALVVGVATALSTRARLAERAEWQASIQRVEDLASYFGGVENGGGFGTLSGTAGVGTLGGSEDHTAILGCHAGQVSQYRFLPTVPLGHTALPAQWVFVVAVSGVHAAKAGSARDRFNRASLACRALVECGHRATEPPAPSLAAALAPPGALEALTAPRDFGAARWLLRRGADATAGAFRGRGSAGAPGRRRLSLCRSRRHDPLGGGVAGRCRAPARQPGARDGRARGLGPLVRSVRCHQLRRRLRRKRLGAGRSRRPSTPWSGTWRRSICADSRQASGYRGSWPIPARRSPQSRSPPVERSV